MKRIVYGIVIMGLLVACVRANPHCKKAHKNIKKLHLQNW
jgi:hypothetical protein